MVKLVLEGEEVDCEREGSKESTLNALLAKYKLHMYALPEEIHIRNERIRKALFVLKKEDDFELLSERVLKKDEQKVKVDFSHEDMNLIDFISSEKEIRPIFFLGKTSDKALTVLTSTIRTLFN